VGTGDGDVRLLDAVDGTEQRRLSGHTGAVSALVFAGQGRIVTGDITGTLRVWDARTGRRLAERREAHRGGVTALALADASDIVFGGGKDGAVRRWDASTLAPKGDSMGAVPGEVTDLDVAPAGLAASGTGGAVQRWDGGGSRVGEPFAVARDTVWGVAINGQSVLAADAEETMSVWQPFGSAQPQRVAAASGHRGGALSLTVVTGGTAAVGAGDGRVHLWDAATASPVGEPFPVSDAAVRHVASAPDGTVWAAAQDGTVVRLDALSLDAACALAADSFDARQRARLLGGAESAACRT
jgi:WD40 repeat protein